MSEKKDSPLQGLWTSLTGASADLHDEIPGIDEKSVKVGHEPDEFGLRGIVYVPIAVTLALLVTYCIITGTFRYIIDRRDTPAESQPFNDRAGRISSVEPKAVGDKPAVAQPGLEAMRKVDLVRSGEQNPDPPFLRSFKATENGNSPEIYPEFLRPKNFVDPTSNKRALHDYDYVTPDHSVVQVPILDAVEFLIDKKKLPVRKDPVHPTVGTLGKAKPSAGGRGGPSEPKEEKKPEHHHD